MTQTRLVAEALDAGYWRDLANQCPRRARSIGKGTPCRLAGPALPAHQGPAAADRRRVAARFRMVAREDGARVKLTAAPAGTLPTGSP